jgi:large subunit ribosomal protein L18
MSRLETKRKKRAGRKRHVRRSGVTGTADKPRMTVFRSNRCLYVQVIDDDKGNTLVSASTLEKDLKKVANTVEGGTQLGKVVGERLKAVKIKKIVFDRNGYKYHGVVKAIADGAREAGIEF